MNATPQEDARTAAVLVAAGKGLRAGGTLAKQWQMLGGKRVIDWTLAPYAGQTIDLEVVVRPHNTAADRPQRSHPRSTEEL